MRAGILYAGIFIAAGLLAYIILRYNRKREPMHFFLITGLICVASMIYCAWQTSTIPDDITRDNYKLVYWINHVLSSVLYSFALFAFASMFMGARKYFARIWEYFKK